MVEITVQIPDRLAQRLQPMHPWLSAALELSLAGFKSPAAVETVAEILDFLETGPSPAQVMSYHVSERAQERLRRLLVLNEGGVLSPEENAELDEIEQIEHILVMLKAQAQEKALADQ